MSPHWPSYIGDKGRTLGKTYGLKQGATGNPGGTLWDLMLSKNSASRLETLIEKSIIAEQIKNS